MIVADGQRPAIGFALSSRGTSARAPLGAGGLLREIDFEQQETILILRARDADLGQG